MILFFLSIIEGYEVSPVSSFWRSRGIIRLVPILLLFTYEDVPETMQTILVDLLNFLIPKEVSLSKSEGDMDFILTYNYSSWIVKHSKIYCCDYLIIIRLISICLRTRQRLFLSTFWSIQ